MKNSIGKIEKAVDRMGNPIIRKRKLKYLAFAVVFILITSFVVRGALLTHYGKMTTTATAKQSVRLGDAKCNWYNWNEPISHTIEEVYGGHCRCFCQKIKNFGCDDAEIDIVTTGIPDLIGIKVTGWRELGYSLGPVATVPCPWGEFYPGYVTVEDGECHITWTFDFDWEEYIGDGHGGYGLVISLDGIHPAFQIHNNDGTDANYPWGTHLYSPYNNGWHSGDTNTPVSSLDWVECTGTRYKNGGDDRTGNDPTPNPDGTFTVTIAKCHLKELGGCEYDTIWWAMYFGVGGFYNPPDGHNGYSQYPATWDTWSGDSSGCVPAVLWTIFYDSVSGPTSFILASGEEFWFCWSYKFHIAIAPGTYNIESQFQPIV